MSMTRTCRECLHYERLGDEYMDEGSRVGQCLLARKKYGRDLKVSWSSPACKGFESVDRGQRPGRKYQGVRRGR